MILGRHLYLVLIGCSRLDSLCNVLYVAFIYYAYIKHLFKSNEASSL